MPSDNILRYALGGTSFNTSGGWHHLRNSHCPGTCSAKRGAGVEAIVDKTKVYNAAGGDAPPGIAALGPDVWCGDLPPARRGFVALGVPIGHPDFVGAHAAGRLEAEADLLQNLQRLRCSTCFATFPR